MKAYLRKKKRFLFKSGKFLLRKIFIATKWRYGFVSSSRGFFRYVTNVIHEKIKVGKMLHTFEDDLNIFLDYYPLLPNYGFIGDHRLNFWIVNEFRCARVPNVSVIDTFTTKALLSMYGIAGNACSIDSTLFFLILFISNYLKGYYYYIIKFSLNDFYYDNLFLLSNKKPLFFRNFRKLKYLL